MLCSVAVFFLLKCTVHALFVFFFFSAKTLWSLQQITHITDNNFGISIKTAKIDRYIEREWEKVRGRENERDSETEGERGWRRCDGENHCFASKQQNVLFHLRNVSHILSPRRKKRSQGADTGFLNLNLRQYNNHNTLGLSHTCTVKAQAALTHTLTYISVERRAGVTFSKLLIPSSFL